ncbi:MAG TPA: rhomboid family intramembrane serine protease [Anaerolineae bacterium]|nr:rhomboid family intramembrane serine protease [Anaerolineae bacterium]
MPIITFLLIAFSTLIYLLQLGSQYLLGYDVLLFLGGKINDLIAQGEYWRLITPIFLHGSLLHLGLNMYALYVLGPAIERKYGRWLFLALYMMAGCYGFIASYWFTSSASVGASTAIFGLIAAQAVFIYRNRRVYGARARPLLTNIAVILLINIILGLSPGIDNWGHFGGLASGLVFAWFTVPRYQFADTVFGTSLIGEVSKRPWLVVSLMGCLAVLLVVFRTLVM